MSLFRFCLACLVGFAMLQYGMIPWHWRRIRRDRTTASIPRLALLATLGFARNLLLIGALTSAFVLAFVSWLQARDGASLAEVRSALAILLAWHERLAWISPGWSAGVVVLLAVALGINAHRRGKLQAEEAFRRIYEREIARLRDRMERGDWPELPPTPEMAAVLRAMFELDAELSSLGNKRYLAAEADRAEIARALGQLRERYIALDIRRRLDLRLDREDVELPRARGVWQRLQGLIMSRGLLRSVGKGSRLLHAANLALIVAAMIGVQAYAIDARIADRTVQLQDLEIRLNRLDRIEALLADAEKEAEEEDESDPAPSRRIPASIVRLVDIEARLRARSEVPPEPVKRTVSDLESLRERTTRLVAAEAVRDERLKQARAGADDLSAPRPDEARPEEVRARAERLRDVTEKLRAARTEPAESAETLAEQARSVGDRLAEAEKFEDLAADRAEIERAAGDLEALRAERLGPLRDALGELESLRGLPAQGDRLVAVEARARRVEADRTGDLVAPTARIVDLRARGAAEEAGRVAEIADLRSRLDALKGQHDQVARRQADRKAEMARLDVEVNRHEVKVRWQEARAGDSPRPVELSADDRAVLREAAEQFEARIVRGDFLADAIPEPKSAFDIRSAAVRDRILRRAQDRAPTPRDVYASMDRIDGLGPAEKEVIGVYARSADDGGFRTRLGDEAYRRLEEAAGRSPTFLEKVRRKFRSAAAQAGRPARADALGREMGAHVLNLLLGDTQGTLGQALGQVLDDTLRRRQEALLYRFLNGLEGEDSAEEALARVGREEPGRPLIGAADLTEIKDHARRVVANRPADDALAARLREHPPAVQAVDEPGVRTGDALRAVDEHVRRIPAAERPRNLEPIADFAATYPVYFPPQPFADRQTEHGRLVEHWESDPDRPFLPGLPARVAPPAPYLPYRRDGNDPPPSVASRPPSPPVAPPSSRGAMIPTPARPASAAVATRSAAKVGMARSFLQLRGFSRIGGVLIGRDPEVPERPGRLSGFSPRRSVRPLSGDVKPAGPTWEVRDLRWEVEGATVRLLLTDADGKVLRSRPFRRSLVEHALAYAADGRPTAVTMVTSQPLADWRILLHPALIDTPFGQRVIEIDRFVDRFTSGADWRTELVMDVMARRDLYLYCWAKRLEVMEARGFLPEQVASLRGAGAALVLRTDRETLARALKDPSALVDPSRSPLKVKSEYFDQELVGWLVDAASAANDLDGFSRAIERRAEAALATDAARWHKEHPNWVARYNAKVEAFNATIRESPPRADEIPAPEEGIVLPGRPSINFDTDAIFPRNPLLGDPENDANPEEAVRRSLNPPRASGPA